MILTLRPITRVSPLTRPFCNPIPQRFKTTPRHSTAAATPARFTHRLHYCRPLSHPNPTVPNRGANSRQVPR